MAEKVQSDSTMFFNSREESEKFIKEVKHMTKSQNTDYAELDKWISNSVGIPSELMNIDKTKEKE